MAEQDEILEQTTSRGGMPIGYWRTTADHSQWQPMLPLLEPHATVYAMDRRGRGGKRRRAGTYGGPGGRCRAEDDHCVA